MIHYFSFSSCQKSLVPITLVAADLVSDISMMHQHKVAAVLDVAIWCLKNANFKPTADAFLPNFYDRSQIVRKICETH